MSDLAELLERVKDATGPDRWLSRDIWQYLDTPEWKRAYLLAQEPCGCPHDQAVEYAARHLADVTASIDAAIALVERCLPGCWQRIIDEAMAEVVGRAIETDSAPKISELPLAILSALIQALGEKQ